MGKDATGFLKNWETGLKARKAVKIKKEKVNREKKALKGHKSSDFKWAEKKKLPSNRRVLGKHSKYGAQFDCHETLHRQILGAVLFSRSTSRLLQAKAHHQYGLD